MTDGEVVRHVRDTARILLVDERDRLLLFLTNYSVHVDLPPRWLTPGGGIDPGESPAEAARRELFEETGLRVESVGDPVWEHDYARRRIDGDLDTGHSTFYLVRVDAFAPVSDNWMPDEFDDIHAHRWFGLDELAATADPIEPAELVEVAREVLSRRS